MKFSVAGLAAGLVLMSAIQACTVLPDRAAKATFMLPAPEIAAETREPIALTLRIVSPYAESPLDSTGILVNPEGQSLKTYVGARWDKSAPVLLRDQWIDGLRQSGSLRAVVNESSEASDDLMLVSELTRFQLHYPDGEPEVVIRLDAQVLESNSREVIAAKRFEVTQRTADKPVDRLVAGFGEANQRLTEELVDWLLVVSRGASQQAE
jgi:cholesterol transport system auxiliary component